MRAKRITASLLAVLLCLLVSQPLHAEGPLRARIKERVAEKIRSAPAPEPTAAVTDKLTKPGDYYFSIPHQGLTRMYRVHVPTGYNPARATPLVFAFHGGGGDMDYMARDQAYGLIPKSNKEGFIIVFPNGFSKLQSGKFATWNAGTCCGDARDKNIDDVGFVKAIVKNISAQMNIDRNRVFATGMSNGGLISYRLACELPEIFRAIASVAGTDNTTQCNPSRTVSILHIHAVNDTHVLFNGGAGEDAFKDISKVTDFVSVPETVSRWVQRNGCRPDPKRVLEVSGAYCDLYDSCREGAQVKLCVTAKGAHSWPGAIKSRGEPTSKAISANDEIWNFFKNSP